MVQSPALVQTPADTRPTRDEARALFDRGDLVPVYRTLLADLDTPLSVYLKLAATGQTSFLLESVEGGERIGRYSFIGVNPKGVITVQDGAVTRTMNGQTTTRPLGPDEDPLAPVRAEVKRLRPVVLPGLPRFVGGAVGFISYDYVRHVERLPETAAEELRVPVAAFMLVDTLIIFDRVKHELVILSNAHNTGDPDAAYDNALARIEWIAGSLQRPLPPAPRGLGTGNGGEVASNLTREQYMDNVRRAKEYIAAGDTFQVVPSQRFSRRTTASPLAIYRALRALNPSPYMFLLRFSPDLTLMGASPEMLVRLEDGIATTRPIAGTRPRGATDEADRALAEELANDPKERAEHVMLVDLGRNDLGRVSEYGTVTVTRMMDVERYSHVMHIVSEVQGRLRAGMDAFDLLRAAFPAGTLTGAPKVRAMEIIEELEATRRGPYGGAVGYFSYDGSMDTCITIRSLLMQGDRVSWQAGGGVVADSDPAAEYQESVNKARALAVAIQRAEEGLR